MNHVLACGKRSHVLTRSAVFCVTTALQASGVWPPPQAKHTLTPHHSTQLTTV
jgi:hypothetical protein